jgi:hypothetical protein
MPTEEQQVAWFKASGMAANVWSRILDVGFEFLTIQEDVDDVPSNLALVWNKDVYKLQDALAGVEVEPVVTIKSKDPFTVERKLKAKACYTLRAQGKKWHEVATGSGCNISNVFSIARNYAKANRLPWPPKLP